MRLKALLLATSVFTITGLVGAQAQSLSGTVSSAEEGQMEGVLVSAKKEGATVTTTVVTNDKGEFSFPAGRLEPGKYTITTRAVTPPWSTTPSLRRSEPAPAFGRRRPAPP